MLPIEKRDFLTRLGCNEQDFQKQLRLPDLGKIERVISLRSMQSVEAISPISKELCLNIVSHMQTMNGHYPFKKSSIKLTKFDPNNIKVGQRFAYRENLTGILENLPAFFKNFMTPSGVSELGAYFIFGKDADGTPSLACYMPPIVERHGKHIVIMDGIHRNYIAMQFGVSLNGIFVENISIPFPCGMREWSELRVISLTEKPKNLNDRYFDLTKELFRDLKYLGIDG